MKLLRGATTRNKREEVKSWKFRANVSFQSPLIKSEESSSAWKKNTHREEVDITHLSRNEKQKNKT